MQNKATDIFSDWAEIGRDQGMAKAHDPAVSEILSTIISDRKKPFSFIDAGCGNGWVVRKVRSNSNCVSACGVDGAKAMIETARDVAPDGEYFLDDLLSWAPRKKADIVHSMEVFYYFSNPKRIIQKIHQNWLKNSGIMIFGIDYYKENKAYEPGESC